MYVVGTYVSNSDIYTAGVHGVFVVHEEGTMSLSRWCGIFSLSPLGLQAEGVLNTIRYLVLLYGFVIETHFSPNLVFPQQAEKNLRTKIKKRC